MTTVLRSRRGRSRDVAVSTEVVLDLAKVRRLFYFFLTSLRVDRGSTVVKVLCYKSEGRWFGPSGFSIGKKSFRSHYGPGVDSASNRNEYKEYLMG